MGVTILKIINRGDSNGPIRVKEITWTLDRSRVYLFYGELDTLNISYGRVREEQPRPEDSTNKQLHSLSFAVAGSALGT